MKKILSLTIVTATLFISEKTIIKAQNIQLNNSNPMKQKLINWGFTPTECQANVTKIRHIATGETVCIQPNNEIQPGNFIYDPSSNEIRQELFNPQTTQPIETEANSENLESVTPPSETIDSKVQEMVFDFNNLNDYGICLDAILLAYEQRIQELEQITITNNCVNNFLRLFGTQIPKKTALQLVDSANYYATNSLVTTLYPSYGIRRRVALNLGYIYAIDQNDPQMLKYAESAR